MNATLGFGFVVLGLSASVFGAAGGAYALLSRRLHLLTTIRQWVWLVVAASVGAFVVMEVALFQRDYTLAYVSKVGSDDTPTLFNFAALWSSLEGSILLWALVLGGYLAAMVVKFRSRRSDPLFGWALVVMLAVTAFFFALMVGPANPFLTVEVPPGFNGPGPNPLLQNHVLVAFHPPMLYLGYVGFTVPFAFAVAALITGRVGEGWLLETRRWTVAAWGFLTFGIVLGAWWSYEVLGWGGSWAWDPVENASLLPWLTGTAFVHSVMVQERRGILRVWNLSLLCATFALTILGTFLTRSGVVDSVHAFADGAVGPWLLVFFAAVAALSVGLIGWRGDELRSQGAIDNPVSREGSFLANNLLFAALAFVVLLGTVFPLIAEAWDGTRLTIGRPYFDSLGRPIGLVLLFLMAIAPLLPWRKASTELLSTRLFWPAVLGVVSMALALVLGARGFAAVLTFGLGGFAGGAALRQIVLATRRSGWRGVVGRTNGGMIVHLGVVLVAVGLAASESYKSDRTVLLDVGESVTVEGHELTYLEAGADVNDRRLRTFALIEIDGGDVYAPAITNFRRSGVVVPTPSVRSGVTEDLFFVLDELPARADDAIRLRVIVRPMVAWIWAGGGLMALGTALALVPGSRRRSVGPLASPASEPDPAERATAGTGAAPGRAADSEPELVGD
ncbi:MAG: cytochrome c biogenesis protein CcsA [Acidimicrobiia bacterium]|nr:cytochrome c biogenesis protein CcsA [Acidimicrobiia bacterium]